MNCTCRKACKYYTVSLFMSSANSHFNWAKIVNTSVKRKDTVPWLLVTLAGVPFEVDLVWRCQSYNAYSFFCTFFTVVRRLSIQNRSLVMFITVSIPWWKHFSWKFFTISLATWHFPSKIIGYLRSVLISGEFRILVDILMRSFSSTKGSNVNILLDFGSDLLFLNKVFSSLNLFVLRIQH